MRPGDYTNDIMTILDEGKAENIRLIDLRPRSSLADFVIIASSSSGRKTRALAAKIDRLMKEKRAPKIRVEGLENADWVLVDIGDIIIHIFRPEVREYYRLDQLWTTPDPPVISVTI